MKSMMMTMLLLLILASSAAAADLHWAGTDSVWLSCTTSTGMTDSLCVWVPRWSVMDLWALKVYAQPRDNSGNLARGPWGLVQTIDLHIPTGGEVIRWLQAPLGDGVWAFRAYTETGQGFMSCPGTEVLVFWNLGRYRPSPVTLIWAGRDST